MSVFHENMLIGASGQGAAGPTAGRSVRFNSADSASLSKTFSSTGNRKTYTLSLWCKRSKIGGAELLLTRAGNPENTFRFNSDALELFQYSGGFTWQLVTTQLFRDPSAWYHILIAFDTTQATSSNRVKLYVNGTQVTAFSTASYPSLNFDGEINTNTAHEIGVGQFNGYLALVHFIDGQALTPSSFGETSATTGQWIAKTYSGSYGTNGFFLDFADNSTAAALGYDAAGSNDWTVNNISVASGGPTSVAAASGALPIYNTTDTYGTTKGTGTRTDSNSSSISLAIAMDGANNGTTFTDESATIKGSGSAKSITRNGDTKTSTTQSKFYGSSGYFDGTGDYLSLANDADFNFGTGDFTIEAWIYVTAWDGSGQNNIITKWNQSGNGYAWKFAIISNGNIRFGTGNNGTLSTEFDFSAGSIATNTWHHFAVTRSGTSIRVFMNGVQIGSSATSSNTLSSSSGVVIGASPDGGISSLLNGYMADLRVYKGVAKYTAAFNPPTSTQIASVAAGNDSLRDHPTSAGTSTGLGGEVSGNYATLNPLSITDTATFSDGNLTCSSTGTTLAPILSTFAVSSGKWYCEFVQSSGPGCLVGIRSASRFGQIYVGGSSDSFAYEPGGDKVTNASGSAYGASWTFGDVIGIAFDATNGTLTFYKNGVSQGSTGFTIPVGSGQSYYFGFSKNSGSAPAVGTFNFGQRAWAYACPAGFSPLVDTLLPTPTIAKPNTVMGILTYTGNGASDRSIRGFDFQPDLVWLKNRTASNNHALFDSVRAADQQFKPYLSTNSTAAEASTDGALEYWWNDGFQMANGATVSAFNNNNQGYVCWGWDAGSAVNPTTNTSGTITSTVRANISAGFSVVTYNAGSLAPATGATVGHGLGVAPQFIIVKDRTNANPWAVYHTSLGPGKGLLLSSTAAEQVASTWWNNTAPSSTVFSINSDIYSTAQPNDNYVAYCWTPVAGYSAFGSYTAGSEPFVHLGFRPRFLMIKNSSTAGSNWVIHDTARSSYNYVFTNLSANSSGADNGNSAYPFIDMLSNGFKLRSTYLDYNQGSDVYVYAAWAEAPFPYARAR